MRRTILGLTALLVICGSLLVEETEAGRRRKCCNPCYTNRCCAPQPTCCSPRPTCCGPQLTGCRVTTGPTPYFCNQTVMMPGNPVTYQGNRYPDGSKCSDQMLTMCTGSTTTCGTPVENCDATHPPSAVCVQAREGVSALDGIDPKDYVRFDPKGHQIVGSGAQLDHAYLNTEVDDFIKFFTALGYDRAFDGYWHNTKGGDNFYVRLLQINDKSGHSFFIGFEVTGAVPVNSLTLNDGDCSSNKPTSTVVGADWRYIREVTYTTGTFVVITRH
jgi:hypothetical protein